MRLNVGFTDSFSFYVHRKIQYYEKKVVQDILSNLKAKPGNRTFLVLGVVMVYYNNVHVFRDYINVVHTYQIAFRLASQVMMMMTMRLLTSFFFSFSTISLIISCSIINRENNIKSLLLCIGIMLL